MNRSTLLTSDFSPPPPTDSGASLSRSHADIRDAICGNAGFDGPFVTVNTLAAIMAFCGLFADSGAIVIGAMIIAILLGSTQFRRFRSRLWTVNWRCNGAPAGAVVRRAVVTTPYSLSPAEVRPLQNKLPKASDSGEIELHIRSILTSETTTEGYVHQFPADEAKAEQANFNEAKADASENAPSEN